MPFYLIDKEKGLTSNAVSSKLKNQLNIKKAGFSGVLDPFATGLLIIGTEGETKFLDTFLMMDKTYSGVMFFGKQTNTLDTDGEVVLEKEVNITLEQVKEVVNSKFIGEIEQVPPVFSNIKVDGKRSHELARSGKEVELKSVKRFVKSFTVEELSHNTFKFVVEVSSGTYIRSLARDIGKELDSPGMLLELRREAVGDINVNNACKVENPIPANRKDLIKINEFNVNEAKFKNILDGKNESFEFDDEQVIIQSNGSEILCKRNNDFYRLEKRIR